MLVGVILNLGGHLCCGRSNVRRRKIWLYSKIIPGINKTTITFCCLRFVFIQTRKMCGCQKVMAPSPPFP